jgi:alpha-L-rhamnosidase
MTAGGVPPRVVLDYGKDVGGIPWIDIGSVSGNPQVKVGYSETLLYLTDNGGDYPPFQGFGNGEGDVNRYDLYTVTAPGMITSRYTQGGERFQVITLTSPGSVMLRGVGINYIADRTQAANYGGYFMSNDDGLNKVWYSGAYTAQLNAVPTRSLPGSYRIENGTLSAWGSRGTGGADIGLFTPGTSWTDYTMSFDTNIVNQQAGWALRTRDPQNGLIFLLSGNQLRAFNVVGNNYAQIASVATPFAITPGTWYAISTSVVGSTATVKINGTQAMSVAFSGLPSGSIGFRQWGAEEARFRNLQVTSSGGANMLNLPLNTASNLSSFRIPGSNEVPSILDGAKRDRLVWSGDLDTAGPTMSYTVGNNDYLKGSLKLFATRQHTSGFIEGVVPSTFTLINASGLTSETGWYSATYSMYVVLGLYDHLMFSGDRAFASSLWPTVQRQLAWNASRLDSRGLFITRAGDGADWDFYDPEKVGAITAYNVMYYRTLVAAAVIGDAIGQSGAAATYRAQAASLKNAINTNMYDSARGVYRVSDNASAIAQDANAMAVLAGIPPASEVPRILATMKAALWTNQYGPMPFNDSFWKPIISTFISGYEAQARYLGNDSDNAEQLIRTVFGRLANPLNFQYTGTMWENVGADGTPGLTQQTSLAHGWATGAVNALSGFVLGIRPTAPGYANWLVQPHPGTLSWVVGQAPTPFGALSVKWSSQRGSGFTMQVSAPTNTSGTIAIPTNGVTNPAVSINGNPVWRNGQFIPGAGPSSATSDGQHIYLNGIQAGSYMLGLTPG